MDHRRYLGLMMTYNYDEPAFTREAQELLDQMERERVPQQAVAKQRAHRLAKGGRWRRPLAVSTTARVVCRTVVTKRGKDGEIQEFERYETPVKPASHSGHQWLPDPIIQ